MARTTRWTMASVAAASTIILSSAAAGATPVYGTWNNGQATFQMGYGNVHGVTYNGTATVSRSGSQVATTISFGGGSAFDASSTNFQICASTSAFTSKVAGQANCGGTPNGTWWGFTETAGAKTATETITLPNAFLSKNAYLQLHVTSNDGGTVNTSMVNPVQATPLYGNVDVPQSDVPLSAGGFTGAVVVVVLGGATMAVLTVRARRRRHALGA